MLSSDDYDDLATAVYAAIDTDMTGDEVHTAVEKLVEDHDLSDPFDLVLLGILIADVWHPGDEDEDEDSDSDEEDDKD
jgi:hypothetical protein